MSMKEVWHELGRVEAGGFGGRRVAVWGLGIRV